MKKKLFAFMLSLAMIMTFMPLTAFADDMPDVRIEPADGSEVLFSDATKDFTISAEDGSARNFEVQVGSGLDSERIPQKDAWDILFDEGVDYTFDGTTLTLNGASIYDKIQGQYGYITILPYYTEGPATKFKTMNVSVEEAWKVIDRDVINMEEESCEGFLSMAMLSSNNYNLKEEGFDFGADSCVKHFSGKELAKQRSWADESQYEENTEMYLIPDKVGESDITITAYDRDTGKAVKTQTVHVIVTQKAIDRFRYGNLIENYMELRADYLRKKLYGEFVLSWMTDDDGFFAPMVYYPTDDEMSSIEIEVTVSGKTYVMNPHAEYWNEGYDFCVKLPSDCKLGDSYPVTVTMGGYQATKPLRVKKIIDDRKIVVTNYTYDGTLKAPKATVTAWYYDLNDKQHTVTLEEGKDYEISLDEWTWDETTDQEVHVTKVKDVGRYYFTIKPIDTSEYQLYSDGGEFTIKPKGTTLSSVAAASKGFTAKWKKQATQTTGYQIQYSTSSTFKSGNKTVTVSSKTTVSKKVTGLKSGKTYYVRVRTYKNTDRGKVYSAWSAKKSVKAK